MVIVMFALSDTNYEIFTNQINCQKFDLENEGQGQEGKIWTDAIRLEMFDYMFAIFFLRI